MGRSERDREGETPRERVSTEGRRKKRTHRETEGGIKEYSLQLRFTSKPIGKANRLRLSLTTLLLEMRISMIACENEKL